MLDNEKKGLFISSIQVVNGLKNLESLLGASCVASLIEELNSHGILILVSKESTYTLSQIHAVLVEIFEQDAADLLMEKIEQSISHEAAN